MKKIFCFINSTIGNDVIVYAVSEDGYYLASHWSSNVEFAKHDIGLTSHWKHETYKKVYPDGYELIWKDNLDDVELKDALEKNKAFKI